MSQKIFVVTDLELELARTSIGNDVIVGFDVKGRCTFLRHQGIGMQIVGKGKTFADALEDAIEHVKCKPVSWIGAE